MPETAIPSDLTLPGGPMSDNCPVPWGEGRWLWTTTPAPDPGALNLSECHVTWFESQPGNAARGWYVTSNGRRGQTLARMGPYQDAQGAAGGVRDMFPITPNAPATQAQYLEERLDIIIEAGLQNRIVDGLANWAKKGPHGLPQMNPNEMIERIQAACDERRRWLDRD